MIDVEFDFRLGGEQEDSEPFLDEYEVEMLFENTRGQIRKQVANKLGTLRCSELGEPPKVKVSGIYWFDTEEFEMQYHIDGCCNLVVMEAIQALNR